MLNEYKAVLNKNFDVECEGIYHAANVNEYI